MRPTGFSVTELKTLVATLLAGFLLLTAFALAAAMSTTSAYAAPGASVPKTKPEEAKLTKVIDAPAGTDASNDLYTFHFAGGGTAAFDAGTLVSDGVPQQTQSIEAGDVIPAIDDVQLKGASLSDSTSVGSGTFKQTTVHATLAYVLGLQGAVKPYEGAPDRAEVTFSKAGTYTYKVTESSAHTELSGVHIIVSKASYLLRVYVKYEHGAAVIDYVTVEKIAKDDGSATDPSVKVDSTLPSTDEQGRITQDGQPIETPAGDFRGRDVEGFTFANEYVKGGHFIVETKTEGSYANHEKLFPTSLIIEDSAAPAGSCVTYLVTGGEDTTLDSEQISGRVDMPEQNCVAFKGNGAPLRIQANLRDGGYIAVTGLYGTYQTDAVDTAGNHRNKLSDGPNQGSLYSVSEVIGDNEPYRVRCSVFGTADVSLDGEGDVTDSPVLTVDGNSTGVSVGNPSRRTLGGSGEYVLIVNSLEATDFSPTGIVARNLPQVLLVGVPVVALVAWLAWRRFRTVGKTA